MPYKIGGGGLPELYNPNNGQYTDEEKKTNYLTKNFQTWFKDISLETQIPIIHVTLY